MYRSLSVALSILSLMLSYSLTAQASPSRLYQQHCAACHGADRLGGTGPALLPGNLKRLRSAKASKVIADGRAASQMPGFKAALSAAEIQSLVKMIYTPLPALPRWGIREIEKSRVIHYPEGQRPNKPAYKADMMNLFVVVELGDHHATILDGDRLEPIHRFATRFALHGGPKYSPDGRYVYFASRDGWISKFDIYNLKVVAEVRAGINTRNMAVSGDGRYAMVANYLPHSLVLLDTRDLKPLKLIPVRDDRGKSSRVSAVYDAAPRGSFIAALKDIPEVWEIPYTEQQGAQYPGFVHDYRMEDEPVNVAQGKRTLFSIKRIQLDDYLDDFFFDQSYRHLIGAARNSKSGQVIDLDKRRKITDIGLTGMPHLGSGITWQYQNKTVLATPNLKEGAVTIIDMENWQTIKSIKTKGPGFFMRSHENSPYAWVDVFFGPNKDLVHVIDKKTLKIVKTLRPAPGKTAAHVEFTRDGRYALLSIWDDDGAVVVYDSQTLKEVKRLPMKKPSGKYNVYNKTHRSEGTSH